MAAASASAKSANERAMSVCGTARHEGVDKLLLDL